MTRLAISGARARLLLLGALVGLVLGPTMPASPASAHAVLESTSPVASSVIPESPSLIELRFNEPLERRLSSVRLFDSDKNEIDIGEAVVPSSTPSRVLVESIPSLDDGVYVVVWRVVSADGHPVTGAFPFQVGGTVTNIQADFIEQLLAGLATESDLGVPLGIARFLAYLGTVVLVGSLVFTWGSPIARHRRVLSVQLASLLALVGGSGAVLVLQGAYASGRSWGAVLDAALVSDVLGTRLGGAILARLALAVAWVLLIGTLAMNRSADDPSAETRSNTASNTTWMNASVVVSFATLATFAVSGHASGESPAVVFMLVNLVHMAAVSAWAGALVVLGALHVRGGPQLGPEPERFSRLATVTMPLAVASGVVLGLRLAGGPGSLTDTDYGRLLLSKLVLATVVVALGAVARRRLLAGGNARIGRVVGIEAAVVVAVLGLTSVLVGASPSPSSSFKASYGVNLAQGDVLVDFQVQPAYVGTVEVHALFTVPGGTVTPVKNVTVALSLPEADIPNIPVEMIELGPNHWSGVVKIPYAGLWRAELRLSTAPNSQVLLTTDVPVRS